MSDALRYRIIDEPRPGPFQRFALPPVLVFLVGNFFLPWGWLLIAANALALNGPHRNREIAFAAIPIAVYFGAMEALDWSLMNSFLNIHTASYLFVLAIGCGMVFAATAYVSQDQTAQLRRYLSKG